MRATHVPFQKMSDLYDDDAIHALDERNELHEHIQSCGECAVEYARLEKTMQFVRALSRNTLPPDALLSGTMTKIKFIRRRKQFYKSVPAIAASIAVVIGVSLFNADFFTFGSRSVVADKKAYKPLNDSEQVIDIIRKHNASIVDVTDAYVEGTVSVESFDQLRRDLGARKVAYMPVEDFSVASRDWGSAIEEVGAADGRNGESPVHDIIINKRSIRFRVFR